MNLLKLVADKTIGEKYTNPDFVFDFFEKKDEHGVYVKENYINMAEKYNRIDMRYDSFDWQIGVGLFGLVEAYKKLKEEVYMEYMKEWVDFHISKGLPETSVNATIPYYTILQVYKNYGTSEYREVCERTAKFVMSQGRRCDEGALEHTVNSTGNADWRFASQIWADTTFMAGIFLAEWGAFTGNDMYSMEAARQIILHYKYLTDNENGLMFHAYSCYERNHISNVHWGRANGWGIISSVEILERLPVYIEERNIIKDNLQRHIDSIVKYQDRGGWHTVVDRFDTYLETTAACAFYYGIKKALKQGYISGDYSEMLKKAEEFIKYNVSENGETLNASAGTPVMASAEEYNKIPCAMSYYSQGLLMLALSQF